MTILFPGLGQGMRVAAAAALFGVISTGAAVAQVNPNCTTTATLAANIWTAFNCDDGRRICDLPPALNACCNDNSPNFADQEDCVCNTYNAANQNALNNKGFSEPAFCGP